MTSLPRALQPDEVSLVLNSFTKTLRSPKRGYAVVRLALDLGLRCIEINRLQLDDIDWQHGTLTRRRMKSRRQDVLPLPVPTGKALEAYLWHERPTTSNRSVFVRSLAPHDAPVSVHAIRRVIRDAFRRAGIPHGRAHALRHTLACRLVNSGGSIKEVADVLRHPENERLPDVLVFRVDASLLYFNVDYVRDRFEEALAARGPGIGLVVFFLGTTPNVDLAGADLLEELRHACGKRGMDFRLAEARGNVRESLLRAGFGGGSTEVAAHQTVTQVMDTWRAGVRAGG